MTNVEGLGGTQVRRGEGRSSLVLHRLRLRAVAGPDAGATWEVAGTRLVIGTAPSADVILADRTVSRRHCELFAEDRGYRLRDLGSTNGTELDGRTIEEAPIAPGSVLTLGDTVLEFEARRRWVRVTESRLGRFGDLVGTSAAMRALFGVLERIAPTRLSCVLLGETGTGKDLVARAIHAASAQAAGPFVVVDCGAMNPSLVESELFGHERGAFTGADRARAGACELANGGTLLLDEIGDLALDLQPKLLAALERREVKRLGAARPVEVDFRVIAATHRPLDAMRLSGAFRDDLYFRLAELVLEMPPLRSRPEDIAPIAAQLLAEEARFGSRVLELTPAAAVALGAHDWPGNVRELRNFLRRAAALAPGDVVDNDDVAALLPARGSGIDRPRALASPPAPPPPPPPELAEHLKLRDARELWVAGFEREYLVRVLAAAGGLVAPAAERAGIHVKSFQRLLRQHGIRGEER